MSWQTSMREILRVMVNDWDSRVYTDIKLERLITVAAFQVLQELAFGQTYTITLSDTAPNMSPDPTDTATKDDSFVNLVCLKAGALTDRGAAILAARRCIAIRDASSAIDLKEQANAWLKLLEKGYNAAYEDAKLAYQMGQTPIAGAAVMTPFRIFAGYSSYGVIGR